MTERYEQLEMARELADLLRDDGFGRTPDQILEQAEDLVVVLNKMLAKSFPDTPAEEWKTNIEQVIYDAVHDAECREIFKRKD